MAASAPNPVEVLNNAIMTIDFVARNRELCPNVDVSAAVTKLAVHWLAWFQNDYKAIYLPMGNVAWTDKLDRYLQWYTRAFALVPAAVRERVPAPHTINVSRSAMIDAELARIADGYRQAVEVTKIAPAYRYLADQAKSLMGDIDRNLTKGATEAKKQIGSAVTALTIFGAALATMYVAIKASK